MKTQHALLSTTMMCPLRSTETPLGPMSFPEPILAYKGKHKTGKYVGMIEISWYSLKIVLQAQSRTERHFFHQKLEVIVFISFYRVLHDFFLQLKIKSAFCMPFLDWKICHLSNWVQIYNSWEIQSSDLCDLINLSEMSDYPALGDQQDRQTSRKNFCLLLHAVPESINHIDGQGDIFIIACI